MPEEHDQGKGDLPLPSGGLPRRSSHLATIDVSPDLEAAIEKDGTAEAAPAGAFQCVFRSKSRSSSVRPRPPFAIPRANRRGFLGRLAIIPEVEQPYEYRKGTKWLITFIVALAAAAAPLGSAIIFPSLYHLSTDFHATSTVTNLVVALYMLSMSIFPLWWSSFSETFGRRTIYLVSFVLFTMFSILSALSASIGMLIAMRMLSGGAAASVQAVGAGTIADIWEAKERGRAMGIFYLGPLMGPLLAPIIGGALAQYFGWRSTQWFLAIYGAVLSLVITFCLPETLRDKSPTLPNGNNAAHSQLSRISTHQPVQQNARTVASVLKRCFIEPLYIIAFLRFAPVALTVYYASIAFGSLYLLNISIQQTFSQAPYSYPAMTVGLFYLPSSLGYVVASIFVGRWTDIVMHREAHAANRYDAAGKLILLPEDRMRENVYIAAVLYPGALVLYGWAVERHLHWCVSALSNFLFGIGCMIIFNAATTMLTEFMPRKSSSGVALNNFIRNIFSCVAGVVGSPLIDAVGNGWLFMVLGLITWMSGAAVWALRRWGPRWREGMDRALNE